MTEERKNEIWAMLTQEEKERYSKQYLALTEDDWDKGYESALCSLFSKHNLTAKLDETTPKSPSYGENEPNLHVSKREMTQKSPSEQNRSLSQDVADCDIETEEEEALLRMEYIAMMEEKKVELEKLREQMNDRYFQ